jgi:PAS domain S-box-containing protein
MRKPALALPVNLQQLTTDLVASASRTGAKGALDQALQQALAHTIETKVNAQLSVLLEGIGDAFYSLDGNWRFRHINRAAETYFGVPRQMMIDRNIWELFPESEGTELRRRYEEVFASGLPASFEAESVGVQGRFLEFHVFPYNGGLGVSFRDWTERRRAEEELRASEARLSALANNAPACMFYQLNHPESYKDRKILYLSRTCESLTGVPTEKAKADPRLLYDLILPEHRQHLLARRLESYRALKEFETEFEMLHAKTGQVRWHRIIVTPRRLENGAIVWDGIQIDITDHKRAEEHLRLLINELNHRVKNTLATVQSIAVQSFRELGPESDLRVKTFQDRLLALARAHDILTRDNWEGAELGELIGEVIEPNCRQSNGRCEVDGPRVRLTPNVALAISMAVHELATNAAKYGALSAPTGHVSITWTVTAEEPRHLTLCWQEHGGPPVVAPARKGFGTRLIERSLAHELAGEAILAYVPAGVVCTIKAPLMAVT